MPNRSMLVFVCGTIGAFAGLWVLALLVNTVSGSYERLGIFGGAALAGGWLLTELLGDRTGTSGKDPDRTAEDIPGLGWIAGADRRITGLGSQFRDHFGSVAYGELCSLEHALYRDDVEEAALRWRRAWKTGGEFYGTYRFRCVDQEYRWFLSTARPLRDPNGQVVGWCGTLVDIHSLKSAEEELSAKDRTMRSVLDGIPAMISVAGANGQQQYNNKASVDFHGKNHERLNGTQFLDSIHPNDREDFIAARAYCMEHAVPLDHRSRVRRRDGMYRWVQTRSQPVLDGTGNVVRWYGITLDIDDQVRAEEGFRDAQEQLARASHLATLAELSASIAHEVKQPLAAVVTNSRACQAWLSADPPNLDRARVTADRIVRDSMAASDVVNRIRELFARKAPTRVATDLRDVVQEVRHIMISQTMAEGTQIETVLGSEPLIVLVDRVQFQQVLVNLIRNGLEAMRSNVEEPRSLSISLQKETSNTALVQVRDTGTGIADPSKVFEPFYTTKDDGMGMGLAICRSIVEAHDGSIWAAASKPRGTVFSVRLPTVKPMVEVTAG